MHHFRVGNRLINLGQATRLDFREDRNVVVIHFAGGQVEQVTGSAARALTAKFLEETRDYLLDDPPPPPGPGPTPAPGGDPPPATEAVGLIGSKDEAGLTELAGLVEAATRHSDATSPPVEAEKDVTPEQLAAVELGAGSG